MTTQTIEYTEVETKQEEFRVCDECGREVDEAGTPVLIPESPHDFNRNLIQVRASIEERLDLCSECYDSLSDEDIKPAQVQRVEDWLDTETLMTTGTIRSQIVQTQRLITSADFISFVGGVVLAGVGGILFSGSLIGAAALGAAAVLFAVTLFLTMLKGQLPSEDELDSADRKIGDTYFRIHRLAKGLSK